MTLDRIDRRIGGAKQRRAADLKAFQNVADDALLQRFHVNDNVWKFGLAQTRVRSRLWGSARKSPVFASSVRRLNYFFASSSSIFFDAGSSLLMRKLRIWPAEEASGLAAVGEAPLFQRD